MKARTPPKKADPGISLAAKLDHKRSALQPFGGPSHTAPGNAGLEVPEGNTGGGLGQSAAPEGVPVPTDDKDDKMEPHDLL